MATSLRSNKTHANIAALRGKHLLHMEIVFDIKLVFLVE